MKDVFEKIKKYLDSKSVHYKKLHHKPTPTSEDAARERDEDVKIGGKAIVLKVGDSFKLFVLSGSRKLDSSAIRRHFNVTKIRFATQDELFELTGLQPGAIPPIGKPILPLDLYIDTSITENNQIAFNAGSLTDSIIMTVDDYLKIAVHYSFTFSK